jgi:hypothetical protein
MQQLQETRNSELVPVARLERKQQASAARARRLRHQQPTLAPPPPPPPPAPAELLLQGEEAEEAGGARTGKAYRPYLAQLQAAREDPHRLQGLVQLLQERGCGGRPKH